MTVMLGEYDPQTQMSILMEHASVAARASEDVREEDAPAPWREMTPEWEMKWLKHFIPNLSKLVCQDR